MTKCFKLNDEVIRGLIEFCGDNAVDCKINRYSVKSVASLFQQDATGYLFVESGHMVLTKEPASIEQIIYKSTSAEEAIEEIKKLP